LSGVNRDKEASTMANAEPPGNLNSSRATAEYFGLKSTRTLNRWRKSGAFPEADACINGRLYWLDRTLRRHARTLASGKSVTTAETSPL
jgi:hypothetical protein